MIDAPNLVRDFGGVGDDATDNVSAFAAFIVAASAAHAGYIPPGTFRTSAGVSIGAGAIRLFGAGMQASQIRLTGSGVQDGIAAVGSSGQGNALVLEDFSILHDANQTGGSGIVLVNNSRAIIRRIGIDGAPQGIWISTSWACILSELYLTNIAGAAIATNSDNSANAMTIEKCSIFQCGGSTSSFAIDIANGFAVRVVGNDIEGGYGGAQFANVSSGTVQGNDVEGMSAYTWHKVNCGSDLVFQGNSPNNDEWNG